MYILTVACLSLAVAASAPLLSSLAQGGAPETFNAKAQVTGMGGAGAPVVIEVNRYTPDPERNAVEGALKTGGFAGFVAALKKVPAVGAVKLGERSWTIRWAREVRSGANRRTLTFVTDTPIFFIGGGAAEPKSRTGYSVGLIQLEVDDEGKGKGTMAAAARVRPGGETGVQVDDYADKPIVLSAVVRHGK